MFHLIDNKTISFFNNMVLNDDLIQKVNDDNF